MTEQVSREARELLADEYQRDFMPKSAKRLRTGQVRPGNKLSEATALRVIEKALTLTSGEDASERAAEDAELIERLRETLARATPDPLKENAGDWEIVLAKTELLGAVMDDLDRLLDLAEGRGR